MTLSALRDDALRATADGAEVRLSLPWIRSLPLAGLLEPVVQIDGHATEPAIALGARRVSAAALADEDAWWYLQDRVVLQIPDAVSPGIHEVSVSFRLEIPYLPGGPDQPLRIPFAFTRPLTTGAAAGSVSRDVDGTS
ncbi:MULTISPECIES: hypothetical protein [Microbacterium]|uniref:hypothetical protein n=1 Tax=Microbacterium TaxID=33882 RepID=UPI00277E76F2|nr:MULTISPECIES: hypothetical protein [Microbacterium]MDQ1082119.1 hypothetical protein [Microbacterium sp. SORGH_AS_0344]MDQ1169111.1 hypothetical protein [Microbacterium proteolyticum]